jgi:hypothetical protein
MGKMKRSSEYANNNIKSLSVDNDKLYLGRRLNSDIGMVRKALRGGTLKLPHHS